MSEINYNDHIALKPGDRIHLIIYYDHAQTQETIEQIREKPILLYTIGKIVNEHTNDNFYALVNTGSIGRYKKPNWRDIIMKSCIISKKIIYTIPENFEK